MAITGRVTLKAAYETGDKPDGSDYVNIFDSFVHLTDTSAQTISSPVTFNGSVIAQTIDATDIEASSIGATLFQGGRVLCSVGNPVVVVTPTSWATKAMFK